MQCNGSHGSLLNVWEHFFPLFGQPSHRQVTQVNFWIVPLGSHPTHLLKLIMEVGNRKCSLTCGQTHWANIIPTGHMIAVVWLSRLLRLVHVLQLCFSKCASRNAGGPLSHCHRLCTCALAFPRTQHVFWHSSPRLNIGEQQSPETKKLTHWPIISRFQEVIVPHFQPIVILNNKKSRITACMVNSSLSAICTYTHTTELLVFRVPWGKKEGTVLTKCSSGRTWQHYWETHHRVENTNGDLGGWIGSKRWQGHWDQYTPYPIPLPGPNILSWPTTAIKAYALIEDKCPFPQGDLQQPKFPHEIQHSLSWHCYIITHLRLGY